MSFTFDHFFLRSDLSHNKFKQTRESYSLTIASNLVIYSVQLIGAPIGNHSRCLCYKQWEIVNLFRRYYGQKVCGIEMILTIIYYQTLHQELIDDVERLFLSRIQCCNEPIAVENLLDFLCCNVS